MPKLLITGDLNAYSNTVHSAYQPGGGEIAQSLASLSIKQAARVRSRLDPLVLEG